MLDKTVPYYDIVMKRKRDLPIVINQLPNNYEFIYYKTGMEETWAGIETSVGEFNSETNALDYFQETFIQYPEHLEQRMVFIKSPENTYAGTITAWRAIVNSREAALLHWMAVVPEYQNKGLGKALITKCLAIFSEIDEPGPIYLSTQTWSYKAIGLYLNAGFEISKEDQIGNKKNEYEKAVPILKKYVRNL
ncbi:GNAT family N-acetyltransferase [Breznakiella homolactica]|uniref:GNAT family N-acetyltransferase n=1 Tax=Breznakiella homolactica TaxID=2798577 RepID=A0A7T8BB11_9SPIR|nr:GNAT family N-acetyltransferase [Breznakiella homolactica]QQO09921.1 GNAT family N-acetyltransferase [Breznakiella homolactica]